MGMEVMIMFINEVCSRCALSRKAIEYYTAQGLLAPGRLENGYRVFSDEDVARLKQIAVLRALGLSIAEIRQALAGPSALGQIAERKRLEADAAQEKRRLLAELAATRDWARTAAQLRQLEHRQSILTRLLDAFPGSYGRFVCSHFAPYLNDPIQTAQQEEAFRTVIDFLDHVDFTLPKDLQALLEEGCERLDDAFAQGLAEAMRGVLQAPEKYLADHREAIDAYLAVKQSEAYKTSAAGRLEASLRQLTKASGYNDVFLPAMRRLSPSYQAYSKALHAADARFLAAYEKSASPMHEKALFSSVLPPEEQDFSR